MPGRENSGNQSPYELEGLLSLCRRKKGRSFLPGPSQLLLFIFLGECQGFQQESWVSLFERDPMLGERRTRLPLSQLDGSTFPKQAH